MSLAPVLSDIGVTQTQFARQTGLSRSATSRLVANGEWPAKNTAALRKKAERFLREQGATPAQLLPLFTSPTKKLAPECVEHAEAAPEEITASNTPEEDHMLLQFEALTPFARAHFKLPRNPFQDDIETPDDVFQTPSVRHVRASLMDCAMHHGFLAVVGESGSGKTTLAMDLEERIRAEKKDIVIIRPYVLAMESNDEKGKTLKSSHIAEAIAYELDPQLKVKSSPQARFTQVHQLLKASYRAGRRHLILIEEAHGMPKATLRHLKRYLELVDGMRRLVGVALIAQPELLDMLKSQNSDLREVAQRLEIIELQALDAELEGYLRHKFARFNLKYEDVFAPDAADAIRQRLIRIPRGGKPADARSECFPLVVNNLVCRAMNAATKFGWPQVDSQVIAGC